MTADERFDRLGDVERALAEYDSRITDIELEDTDEHDGFVATLDVDGVSVTTLREDNALLVYSDDDRMDDIDDAHDHVNKVFGDDDILNAVLDEAEELVEKHGVNSLSDYRDRLRGDT